MNTKVTAERRSKINEIINSLDNVINLMSKFPMTDIDRLSLASLGMINSLYSKERSEMNKVIDQTLRDSLIDCKHDEVVQVTDSDHSRTIYRCNRCNSYFGDIPEGSKVIAVEEK